MEQNKPAFAQRCEALANDEKACHEAYNAELRSRPLADGPA